MKPTANQRERLRERPKKKSPVMFQTWDDLLFLHWDVDPDQLQRTLPDGLKVDTFEGKAYLGIIPFYMKNIRPRWFPCVPYISNFLECNVRTYVYDEKGNPGVWFYSLDTSRWIAYKVGRAFFSLPYYWAEMKAEGDHRISYSLRRRKEGFERVTYDYKKSLDGGLAKSGTLDYFLLERYQLFATNKSGRLLSCRVHHSPYRYSPCDNKQWASDLFSWNGFDFNFKEASHSCVANRVDVEIFKPQLVA